MGMHGVIPVESQGIGAAIWLVQYNNSGEWTPLKLEWADALEKYMECCPKDVEWCGKIWCVEWYEKGWKSKDGPQWQKEEHLHDGPACNDSDKQYVWDSSAIGALHGGTPELRCCVARDRCRRSHGRTCHGSLMGCLVYQCGAKPA